MHYEKGDTMRALCVATVAGILVVVGLVVSPAAPSASDASQSLLNADRALAAQSQAIGFVPAYSKVMAPDARKLDPGSRAAIGRDAILALMARYPPETKVEWKAEEAVVADSGELGFTWGYYVATGHDSKGQVVKSYGKYLDVWRRQSDGTWRWIADVGNDSPPPA
jgi:ketosteroid isomerase-like protein